MDLRGHGGGHWPGLTGEKQLDQAEELTMYNATWNELSAQVASEEESVKQLTELLRHLTS